MTTAVLPEPEAEQLMVLFDTLFEARYHTRLICGDEEPLYRPAAGDKAAEIIFAHGFFASALHEVSHWCIAGPRRRQLEDYGYWYLPDGRDQAAQQAFEQAEVAPQALESLFCEACERRFNVSVDNLDGSAEVDREAFAGRVRARAERYRHEGLPLRAGAFHRALTGCFGEGAPPTEAAREAGCWLDSQR
ncbi:elongation factor P hydroxylase [Kushneria sinocarnis]|nr:elongation factor P hydroxylase [Kushneria sinocarnis]